MAEDPFNSALRSMRDDWDRRARDNAKHYVATLKEEWNDIDFYASGEQELANHVLNDMGNICQGRDPRAMRVLEIGCGAARVTRALAHVFGEVHSVDISTELIALARAALANDKNAFVYQNNGTDLTVVPDLPFDFAFSTFVFQHIPTREVIDLYFREVARLLRPGALFKLQVQGRPIPEPAPPEAQQPTARLPLHWRFTARIPLPIRRRFLRPLRRLFLPKVDAPAAAPTAPPKVDTWVGVMLTPDDVQVLCDNAGFELRYQRGAGSGEYWLWCFRR